ncbi:lactonase family protein [Paenibacillus paeoniae]|uniref:Lactonase family protein n=1 Tax=Paenibacillus paeoniae TaxID=2292705 RepID=A0A371PLJ3_9BACL|nr:lactonase family protein [Paenibacillus paeoniae]REK77078.1 lactonase family protein [Paenibacillus paeoniae]
MAAEQRQLLVFSGSYAEESDLGLRVFRLDETSGQLTETGSYAGLKNPTFVHVDAERKLLYSISEGVGEEGKKAGEVASFRIDEQEGTLELLSRRLTVTGTTCHIQRDPGNRFLSVTSYHGGMIGLLRIEGEGIIGELADVRQHEGSSVDPQSQDRPHPHSSFYSPDGRFLLVQDLGLDLIATYRLDAEDGKLILHDTIRLHGGAGPRHLTFHPSGKFAFVINELNSTITSLAYDQAEGKLEVLDTVSTLPDDYNGENGTAEIAISQDGRYLYGSNRGHDSIVVFAVNADNGSLSLLQHIHSGGGHPRHFSLTPNGKFLLVANRDANNIVTFSVDAEQGTLQATGYEAEATKPVCVVPTYFTV